MNISLKELSQYLHNRANLNRKIRLNQGWKYASYEELVLDCGKAMESHPMPKDLKRGSPRSCYFTSQRLAFKHNDLVYVEGYAVAEGISIAIAHAWLLTAQGAVDPTWNEPGAAYYGVAFSTDWIKAILTSRKQRGRVDDLSIIEGNYLEGCSLLKEGLPKEAYFK